MMKALILLVNGRESTIFSMTKMRTLIYNVLGLFHK